MMKIRVSSLNGEFESYELENVVSLQYVRNILVVTRLNDKSGVDTTQYSAGSVMVTTI